MGELLGRMIQRQVLTSLIVACLAFLLAGLHGGLSALAGGLAVILGSLAAKWNLHGKQSAQAGSILVAVLIAEAIKIAVIAITLLMIFTLYSKLVPIALIAGLAAAAIMSGAAIFAINEKNNA